jgi:hypothetical protein
MRLKQMQDEAQALEARIAQLEAEIQAAELALSDFASPNEAVRLSTLLELQRAELDRAMAEWESVSEQIQATA